MVRARSKVLIVENDYTIAENLYSYLEIKGYEPDAAYDGHAALAMLASGGFDAVILDIGLPGVEAAVLAFAGIVYDIPSQVVSVHGQAVHLPRKSRTILELLLSTPRVLAPRNTVLQSWLITTAQDTVVLPEPLRLLQPGTYILTPGDKTWHVIVADTPAGKLYLRYDATVHEARVYELGWIVLALGCLFIILAFEREFASNLGHEIRTALTAIRSDGELLLLDPALSERGRQRLQRMTVHVDTISSSLASAESLSRDMPVSNTEVHVRDCIEEAWLGLESEASRQGLIFVNDVPDAQVRVLDPYALLMVARNLIRNAADHAAPAALVVSQVGKDSIAFADCRVLRQGAASFSALQPLEKRCSGDVFGVGVVEYGARCGPLPAGAALV